LKIRDLGNEVVLEADYVLMKIHDENISVYRWIFKECKLGYFL